jgi:lysophospholipase L1-like esterase
MNAVSPSSRPRRSRAALLLFLLVLAALAWEVAVRAIGSPAPTPARFLSAAWSVATGGRPANAPSEEDMRKNAYRPLPYVMFGLKPDWERLSRDGLTRTSNRLGFRGREIELPKPEGRFRIVCLGGSTTYSDAVSDDETYPVHLERVLRDARPDLDIEVVNAGIPSYTTAESLANLAFRVIDLQPDVLVVYHAVNDYRPRVYRNFDRAYFHYRKVWNGTVEQWEPGPGEMAGGINPFIQHNLPPDNGDNAENVRRAGTGAYRRNLLSLSGLAAAHDVRTAFVSFVADEQGPYRTQEFIDAVLEHNLVMREVAERQGDLFIDLHPRFPQGQGLFHDPVHMNDRGTLIKARLIAEVLAPTLP